MDLDTAVSKLDARLVEQAIVVAGPYSALYGPGRQFIDLQLIATPRFEGGFALGGASTVDYRTNGAQVSGRQALWGGDDVWGFRAGYGHRTGSDYSSGDGSLIPSSYKSRDIDLGLGAQLTPNSSLEGMALRLDQTDVELAGQAFDIDWLKTDGYEIRFIQESPVWADRVDVDGWYNQTSFAGSAQRAGKRAQFPILDRIAFTGNTWVDSLSTGIRAIANWETSVGEVRAGADCRYVKQQLTEITSGTDVFQWIDQNSPIPKSDWVNPGLFLETAVPLADAVQVKAGGRIDYSRTNVLASATDLYGLGVNSALSPLSAQDIWGNGDLTQNDLLGLGYAGLDVELTEEWIAGSSVGYSERAPNLTERYAVETFMFILQNGLNTVTGDPSLDKERAIQTDLRIAKVGEQWRGSATAFYSWVRDYVTYETLSANYFNDVVEQVNYKFVNTDLATLWGCHAQFEYDWNDHLVPFATVKYVQGVDRTRNGSFDTVPSQPGTASTINPHADRGTYVNQRVIGGERESLPNILPLESRIGFRLEDQRAETPWGIELYARVVDRQNRVAASLLESTTPGFTVWDLRTYCRPRDNLQLIAGVENFTDKQYREHLDYRSDNPAALSTFRPGISFYFGADLSY
ncbi:MAG: TonB-dependent receptor [Pirellulales bacterium]|nr:TonB-dependent receptor [Pirellulales bacterium]